MIKGEENKQYCKNCGRGPLKRHQYKLDFYNIPQCSDTCEKQYAKYRDKEYDKYVDPTGYYRAKAKSKYD